MTFLNNSAARLILPCIINAAAAFLFPIFFAVSAQAETCPWNILGRPRGVGLA